MRSIEHRACKVRENHVRVLPVTVALTPASKWPLAVDPMELLIGSVSQYYCFRCISHKGSIDVFSCLESMEWVLVHQLHQPSEYVSEELKTYRV